MIDKIFKKPFLIFLVLFFFVPQPTMQIGAMLRVSSTSTFFLLYLYRQGFLDKHKINKTSIANYSTELKLFGLYTIYELVLLLFQPLSKSNITFTLRPIFFLFIFAFSFFEFSNRKTQDIVDEILKSIYIILFLQYAISMLQLLDIKVLSFLYSDDKSYPLGKLVRITGTLGNPNIFAWYIGQFILFVLLFEKKSFMKYLTLISGVIFTFLTGSRTMLVLSPIMWISGLMLYNYFKTKDKKVIVIFIGSVILIFIGVIGVLYSLQNILPYAAQLLNIFKGGLSKVNSFNLRLNIWKRELNYLNENISNWLFGFRNASYGAADNDILYGITRSGLIGVSLNYIAYILFFIKLIKFPSKNKFTAFLITTMTFSFIVGLQAESYMGWFYPVLILLFIGSQGELQDI